MTSPVPERLIPVRLPGSVPSDGCAVPLARSRSQSSRNDPSEAAGSRGFYRNQFWVPERNGTRLLCLGIHGQTLLVDTARDLVAVKLSWWPTPQDPARFTDALAALDRLAEGLDLHPPATSPLAR